MTLATATLGAWVEALVQPTGPGEAPRWVTVRVTRQVADKGRTSAHVWVRDPGGEPREMHPTTPCRPCDPPEGA